MVVELSQDPNVTSEELNETLYWMSYYGWPTQRTPDWDVVQGKEMVRVLIQDRGADINAQIASEGNQTPLDVAGNDFPSGDSRRRDTQEYLCTTAGQTTGVCRDLLPVGQQLVAVVKEISEITTDPGGSKVGVLWPTLTALLGNPNVTAAELNETLYWMSYYGWPTQRTPDWNVAQGQEAVRSIIQDRGANINAQIASQGNKTPLGVAGNGIINTDPQKAEKQKETGRFLCEMAGITTGVCSSLVPFILVAEASWWLASDTLLF